MSAFSEAALEKKLSELSNSQQSVQTLSLWLIHHRKHSRPIVTVWERELRRGERPPPASSRRFPETARAPRLPGSGARPGSPAPRPGSAPRAPGSPAPTSTAPYPPLALGFLLLLLVSPASSLPVPFNHAPQLLPLLASPPPRLPSFTLPTHPAWTRGFLPLFLPSRPVPPCVPALAGSAVLGPFSETDESCKKHLGRVLSIWEERSVYENDVLEQLKQALYGDKKTRKRTYEQIKVDENENCSSLGSPSEPPQTLDLIRALQDLENAASGDAAVHQRIASLPVEVQEVSLLDKITDKESGERLSQMVEDACMLLADCNGRLAAEIDDRKQLTRMLADFLRCQKEALAEKEHKLEEYKHKLARVSLVRKELRSRIQSLPDLSRLPNVTGSHMHLPFAGDIYSED
ncbi:regulation of nuclear pre-mRNA domain-containing protein 1A [Nannospalax galili]|uniref:regulation of nuclear pre-mRNA domain-containing protein 1A n=1 Tax=Nannospalax galili TaxID=1026970 RepID=UPI00111BDC0F|nr:regulation of nuclear pre-mRNA domain-containing protein 1A [Nannospalax galili]